MIPLIECQKGYTYAINSRNLGFGVFDGDEGFVGIREKFNNLYLFTEHHHDQGPPFGTVRPFLVLEWCPVGDLRENLETICSGCGTGMVFVRDDPKIHKGKWYHTSEAECPGWPDTHPQAPINQPLFDYLTDVEKRYDWTGLKVLVGEWTPEQAAEAKADLERR